MELTSVLETYCGTCGFPIVDTTFVEH